MSAMVDLGNDGKTDFLIPAKINSTFGFNIACLAAGRFLRRITIIMITLFHGQDILESRRKVKEIAGSFKGTVINLDGQNLDLTTLAQALYSESLFGAASKKLVVVENFLSKGVSQKTIDYLEKLGKEVNLIFWEGKKLDQRKGPANKKKLSGTLLLKTLSSFVEIKDFKDNTLWYFLDSLYPGNKKQSLKLACLLAKKIKESQTEHEELTRILINHFRLLISVLEKDKETAGRTNPYRLNKLTAQAKFFSKEKLLEIHKKIFEFEVAEKFKRQSFEEQERFYRHRLSSSLFSPANDFWENFNLLVLETC